ncbi:PAS domain S-box protein [Phaeospirillum tilakii]|uniref:histidine kinase n=1 Tax=Phaeospirillum tilakii TaxID=741673 RepID=A0ABW5C8I6_9PROT
MARRFRFLRLASRGADPVRWVGPLALMVSLVGVGAILAVDLVRSHQRDYAAARAVSARQIDRIDRQIAAALRRIDLVLTEAVRDAVPLLAASGRAAVSPEIERDLARWSAFLPEGTGMVVRDAAGLARFPAGGGASWPGAALLRRMQADPGGGLLVELLPGAEAGQLSLGRPVRAGDGRLLGLIEVTVRPDYFQAVLAALPLPLFASATLLDNNLRLAAREPALPTELGRPLPHDHLRAAMAPGAGLRESEIVSPLDGVSRLFQYRKLQSLPYLMLIGRAPLEFLADWRDKAAFYGLAYGALTLALLALLRIHLRGSEDRRRLVAEVFDSAREGIVVADRAGRILAANAALGEITGYAPQEAVGRDLGGLLDPAGTARLWPGLVAEGGWRGEVWTRRKSGEPYPQWLSVAARRDRHGVVTHYIGVVSDLSELHQARRQAEETHRRLEQAQTLAGLGWWDYEPASGRLAWSATTFAILGRDPAEGMPSLDSLIAAIEPEDRDRVRACCRGGEPGESESDLMFRIRRPDGELRHVVSRFHVVSDGGAVPLRLAGTLLDVTEREAIIVRLDLFRRILDSSPQGVGIADAEGRILFANRACLTMTGHEAAALTGRHYLTLVEDPEADAVRQRAQALAAGQGWTGVIGLRRADGTTFPSYSNAGAVCDAQGRVQYLFDIFSDFTDEIARQRELGAARDSAEAASRAKSAFLANMSHELRTPMNAILGFSQFVMMDPTLAEAQRERIAAIYHAGSHLLELINDILDLARVEAGRIDLTLDRVELVPVLRECADLIQPLARERGVSVELAAGADLAARADRLRLRQVLVNLLSNAVKYNHQGGSVRLSLGRDPTGRVRVSVADTGPGIPPERVAELFTPFNRLGAERSGIEGTGIGLALSRRILEEMEGAVGVESRPGRGSLFWIDLPPAVPP